MSHSLSNHAGQSPPNESHPPNLSNFTDLSAIATMFQDIAHILLRYGEKSEAEKFSQAEQKEPSEQIGQAEQIEQTGHINQKEQGEQVKQTKQANLREQSIKFCYDTNGERTSVFCKEYRTILDSYERGEFHDEIRCFLVSASSVRKEYELLNKYDCCYLAEVLNITHKELSIIVKLIGYLDKDVNLSATELYAVSNNLSCSLEKLQVLHRQLEDFKLLHVVTITVQ